MSGSTLSLKLTDIKINSGVVTFNTQEEDKEELPIASSITVLNYLNEADISWTNSGDISGTWILKWRENGSSGEWSQVGVEDESYLISNLKEATKYNGEIIFKLGERVGKTITFTIQTTGAISDYPFIGTIKSKFAVGSVLNLVLSNMPKDVALVSWYLDDVAITDEKVLDKAGKFTLKAEIKYNDKSVERITRVINVQN